MFNFYLTYSWLHWTRPSGPPAAAATTLPAGIQRTFILTPGGSIELLSAKPRSGAGAGAAGAAGPARTAVVFAHGGMGGAWVWIPYMLFLARHGVASYAVSTRGHGASWHPTFLRMVYGTSRRMLADDLAAGIKAVQAREGCEVVLVGHSSGAGLSQYLLSRGEIRVKGLALLGAVPGTGSWGVYLNWAALDPWFMVRMIFHGWHPNSPLSHPCLTRRAFFSDQYPDADLVEFQRYMNRYESYLWPLGMMVPFVDAKSLVSNVTGWGSGERILIMAGSIDKLTTQDVQQDCVRTYRAAFAELVRDKKIDARDDDVQPMAGAGDMDDVGHGVRLAFVPDTGHHLQNDVPWQVGATKLLSFLEQL